MPGRAVAAAVAEGVSCPAAWWAKLRGATSGREAMFEERRDEGYLDYVQRRYPASIVGARSLGYLSLILVDQPAGEFEGPPSEDLVVYLVRGSPLPGEVDLGGGRFRTHLQPGDFGVYRPSAGKRLRLEGPSRLIGLGAPVRSLAPLLAEVTSDPLEDALAPLYSVTSRDPFVKQLLHRVWAESADGNPVGRLFADGAAAALTSCLLRLAGRRGRAGSARAAGSNIARVLQTIDDRLDEDLSLAGLAAEANLPTSQFTRAFKRATGMAPYQFVLQRRIERARQLLESGKLSLAEIAYAVGFSSQAHMTSVFTKELGVSPGRYRQQRRG